MQNWVMLKIRFIRFKRRFVRKEITLSCALECTKRNHTFLRAGMYEQKSHLASLHLLKQRFYYTVLLERFFFFADLCRNKSF